MTAKDRLFLICGAVLFLMALVWLLRNESNRFRDEAKEVVREEGPGIVAEAAGDVVDKMGDEAGEFVGTTVESAGDLLGKAADVAGELAGGSRVSEREKSSASQAEEASEPETEEADDTKPQQDPRPSNFIEDVFKLGTDMAESVDQVGQQVLGLSTEEETEIGQKVHEAVEREFKILNSPDAVGRLQKLAAPLLELRERKSIQFRFYVIDNQEVNAFSHLGGYVYVNTGLLNLAESDAELQFVVAHEIAHVDLKHCVDKLTYSTRASELAGDLGANVVQAAYHSVALGYSESQEFEADAWAYRALMRIGRSREEAMSFSRRILAHEKNRKNEEEGDSENELLDAVAKEVDTHFRSHPPAEHRIKQLQRLER